MSARRRLPAAGPRGPALLVWLVALAAPAGAAHAQDADAGVSPDAPAATTTPADDVAPPPPWAGTTDVPPPAFLDTTDRRIVDERPRPTEEQIRALLELEAEVDRFTRAGGAYRSAIVSILRREYLRQRRDRETGYARQIEEEQRLTREAMERAITLFERFIRRYPDDPNYTPDAMFRLGELYYERAALAFEDAETDSGHPDFAPVVDLFRDLLRRFPGYRHVDGVYYLIGYCLNEMGELEEAVAAWRNLVCANHYTYTGPVAVAVSDEPTADELEEARIAAHPSLGLTAPAPAAVSTSFVDPYVDCVPVREGADFVMETWLRIGEYHFDFDPDPFFLEASISAYGYVLRDPTDRNYNLALYKVAWAYYRGSHYPEALHHFGMLVDWADAERARTGESGSELRPEAIQYLAFTFAYDDWDEDGVPDGDVDPRLRGIVRLQDASLMPQDRPWTQEVYFELGDVYFEEARYDLAIEVWELALRRWPHSPRAPEVTNNIATAHHRRDELDAEREALSRLGNYRPGTEWYDANTENPLEQNHAEELAEAALINNGLYHHNLATTLRRRAVEERDATLLAEAMTEYGLAVDAYRGYLEAYPNSDQGYDVQYNLADALYWSERYEDAAEAYGAVRDSNLDDRYLGEAARRVVVSLQRLMEAAAARGEIEVRDEPPEPSGTPPRITAVEMPALVQRVAQAREIYNARVDEAHDVEHVRDAYEFNNTLLLYYYGYWDQARNRFWRTYVERCDGPDASMDGSTAWTNLRNMAVALGDDAEVRRLATDFAERNCSFTPGGEETAPPIDCEDEANEGDPRCLARLDLQNIAYRDALEIYSRAETARCSGAPAPCPDDFRGDMSTATPLYEDAATRLLAAVNEVPDHPDAPRALLLVAQALVYTGRNDAAARIFQRVIDDVGPMDASRDPARQAQLDNILGVAYFSLATAARRSFDYDRALQNYRTLAESRRFERSTDPAMPGMREDAVVEAARMLEYIQNYADAATYYRRAAEIIDNPAERRAAYFRIALMSYRRHDWAGTIREMNAFIDRYRSDSSAVEEVVEAAWRIYEARVESRASQSDRNAALRAVVDHYTRLSGAPGSMAAEYAAHARFILAEPALASFEGYAIDPGHPATLEAYVGRSGTLLTQIRAGGAEAARIGSEYEPVIGYRRPVWTVAALVRQGRAYEILASAILNAPFVMPDDLARQTRRASPEVREEIRTQVEDRIRQALEPETRVVECFAVYRYALAARAARAASMDNEYTRTAIDRLQVYGEERIAECIELMRTGDPAHNIVADATIPAYTSGEFERARRGETMSIDVGEAPPALAPAE